MLQPTSGTTKVQSFSIRRFTLFRNRISHHRWVTVLSPFGWKFQRQISFTTVSEASVNALLNKDRDHAVREVSHKRKSFGVDWRFGAISFAALLRRLLLSVVKAFKVARSGF